jgi:hypothetical protein
MFDHYLSPSDVAKLIVLELSQNINNIGVVDLINIIQSSSPNDQKLWKMLIIWIVNKF